ncbi:MAG TPA: hypothetical protein VEU52_09595 [Candidatus Limnocylindrales bacterium]|jgi:hypothetical protein|nr:hypothetical protein [Candidatus Limnocylindrales bacterium]
MKTLVGKIKRERAIRVAALAVAALGVIFALAPHAAAQGCAMCYQNAVASGPQGREALRHGILVLLVPTISLFLGIFGLLYTRRNISR